MKWPFTLKRVFTLFPRRFYSHSWGGVALHFTRWWQWGRRCFFIRTKTFVRLTFSSWQQILDRCNAKDKDALLIYECIKVMSNGRENWQKIYDDIIKKVPK